MKKITLIYAFLFVTVINAQISDFKNIDFTRADNIAKLNKQENLKSLSLLSHKLTSKLSTDVEKFRAIYTWVCSNISGDSRQQNIVSHKRGKFKNDSISLSNWNTNYKKKAFKKLLKNKKTMCTGYAYLIKELALLANIECKIINGYGRTISANIDSLEMENHSWNAVKLNNKWYLCDATWSSGYLNENDLFIKDYNDGYFLANPVLFAKNHYPKNPKWLLNYTTNDTTFLTAPLIYGEAFKHKIIPLSPQTMKVIATKDKKVNFSFKTFIDIPLNKVSLIVFIGNNEKKLEINDIKKENEIVTFNHTFKIRGYYDIHLKIDNDIVATYTIKVIKN